MKNFVENYIKENVNEENLKGYDYNLLNSAEITEGFDCVTLDWTYMKWYDGIDGYEDVNAIMKSLSELAKKDIDYQFMRIGEEIDDIQELWHIENNSFDGFYVSRNFEG